MASSSHSVARKNWLRSIWTTFSSIKTGVVLLIIVVIFSALGTVILQRPMTDPEDMQRAYSPAMLRFLDAVGLTDVFHTRWFVALMILVSFSIVAASVERFPNSWRFFARPYKSPEDGFRRVLPTQAQIPIKDEEFALGAAERALHRIGMKSERIVRTDSFSLFSEKHRISEMAVYIVHASLLLIFLGGIVDALYGWRGFVQLTPGTASNQIDLRSGGIRDLGFSLRCDGAGEETYTDGTPKKYWSKLAIVDQGREIFKKEIVVNDPLVYRGVRFYQSSYGNTGKLEHLTLNVLPASGTGEAKEISLAMDQAVPLDADTKVQLAEFIPDYVVEDGKVFTRSTDIVNPAVHLIVTEAKTSKVVNVWLPAIPGVAENEASPYIFQPKSLETGVFTGLQVSHEPGQWAVWSGVALMALGLTFVFYVVHVRLWVVPARNVEGQLVLWVGGSANRNRDAFEQTFKLFVEKIKEELQQKPAVELEPSSAPLHKTLSGTAL